ncbi:hypothetical protein VPNG_00291 [Cytospora leucostoma]|uniref:Uncharacterized protein n=1 Tax=Cytospora leucostoma TaxID=1230097 RepID=A0A423XPF6_9PEZI|nr:hypothetical protein VPNG_00291 [Cytospora leucostoma]
MSNDNNNINNNNNNPKDNDNDPSNQSSRLSAKARLAYYLTGGTGRGPSNMTTLVKMARERNDVSKGSKAWDDARKAALDEHHERWGRPGLAGRLDEARGLGPKPRGRALVRWYREEGGGAGSVGQGGKRAASADRRAQSAQDQQNEQEGKRHEDDIYGASDEEPGQQNEEKNGSGNNHVGTNNGDRGDDSGDGEQGQEANLLPEHQGID